MNTAINYHILTCATSNVSIKKRKSISSPTSHITRMDGGAREWAHFYSLCSEFLLLYSISSLYFPCGSSRFLKLCSDESFLRVNEKYERSNYEFFVQKEEALVKWILFTVVRYFSFLLMARIEWKQARVNHEYGAPYNSYQNAKIGGAISVSCFYDGAKSLNE